MAPILLVTRPAETASGFARKVEDRNLGTFDTIYSPALEITELNPDLPKTCDNLILTSANGVRQAIRLKINVSGSVFCVGERTTEIAKLHYSSAIKAGNCAKELIDFVVAREISRSILHLSGQHTRGDIVENLVKAGCRARRVITYDQRKIAPTKEAQTALMGTIPVVLPLFSTRSAVLLAECTVNAPVHLVAISETVKAGLPKGFGDSIEVVNVPDEAHMVEAAARVLARLM